MIIGSLLVRSCRFVLASALVLAAMQPAAAQPADGFEVWLVDQSNSPGKTFGGAIAIFDGDDISGRPAARALPVERIDLGGDTATLCMAETGASPVRPHML